VVEIESELPGDDAGQTASCGAARTESTGLKPEKGDDPGSQGRIRAVRSELPSPSDEPHSKLKSRPETLP
jgi:hypothetical protein